MNHSPWFAQRSERRNRAMRKHAGTNRRRPLALDPLEERMLLSGFLQPASGYLPSGTFPRAGEYAVPAGSANSSEEIASAPHVHTAHVEKLLDCGPVAHGPAAPLCADRGLHQLRRPIPPPRSLCSAAPCRLSVSLGSSFELSFALSHVELTWPYHLPSDPRAQLPAQLPSFIVIIIVVALSPGFLRACFPSLRIAACIRRTRRLDP